MDSWSTPPAHSAAAKVISTFKRSFSMNTVMRGARNTSKGSPYLSTPEEGLTLRYNLGPTTTLRPPPTVREIASGLATSGRHGPRPRKRPANLPPHLPPPSRSSLKSSSSSITTTTTVTNTSSIRSATISSTSSLHSLTISQTEDFQPGTTPRQRKPLFFRSLSVPMGKPSSASSRSDSPTDTAVSWGTDDPTLHGGRKLPNKVRFSLEPEPLSDAASVVDNKKPGVKLHAPTPKDLDGALSDEKKPLKTQTVKSRFFTR